MKPANETPPSLSAQILAFFEDSPPVGFRCYVVAQRIGRTTWEVANECGRMYRRGQLVRQTQHTEGRKQPITYYSLPR